VGKFKRHWDRRQDSQPPAAFCALTRDAEDFPVPGNSVHRADYDNRKQTGVVKLDRYWNWLPSSGFGGKPGIQCLIAVPHIAALAGRPRWSLTWFETLNQSRGEAPPCALIKAPKSPS